MRNNRIEKKQFRAGCTSHVPGTDRVREDGPVRTWREHSMAAMKPRTGDGPLEATKEGRGIVMRVPLEGGGRLVVELTPDEAAALGDELKNVTS
ncbi:hypothetical protein B1R94_06955 [Mycolicibacterium litorale]|nr:hypothetical protein B1R94_06955 [Mycolicibacterium litorale]